MAKRVESPSIGIDLGTTFGCVGVYKNGHVEIVPNVQGNRKTPACVALTHVERLIGEAADSQLAMNPLNTVFGVKRLLGRRLGDQSLESDQKWWSFKVVAETDGKPQICLSYKGKTVMFAPEDICAMVLSTLKDVAQAYIGREVKNVVVSIPTHFTYLQRSATVDACVIAGLNVIRTVPDTLLAGLTYCLEKRGARAAAGEEKVMVFDLGGGTLGVSLMTVGEGGMEVKAAGGDTHLGGEDFTNRLLEHLAEEFSRKHGRNVRWNARAMQRLRMASERAKRTLSTIAKAMVEIDSLYDDLDFRTTITRDRFEELNADLFQRCVSCVETTLKDAGVEKREVKEVVLVGGSSRVPKIQQMLSDLFGGKELCKSVNPDEAVAYGAAVQAATLEGSFRERAPVLRWTDVTPHALGIEVGGGMMDVVIPRNSLIPAKKELFFSTHIDNQPGMQINVFEGECRRAWDNRLLRSLDFGGLPPSPAGYPQIFVNIEIDANYKIQVLAEERRTGMKKCVDIEPRGCLTKLEIARMVEEAERFKAEDRERKRTVDARNALEEYVFGLQNRYLTDEKGDGSKADAPLRDREEMDGLLQETLTWLEDNQLAGAEEVVRVHKELERLISPITGRFASGADGDGHHGGGGGTGSSPGVPQPSPSPSPSSLPSPSPSPSPPTAANCEKARRSDGEKWRPNSKEEKAADISNDDRGGKEEEKERSQDQQDQGRGSRRMLCDFENLVDDLRRSILYDEILAAKFDRADRLRIEEKFQDLRMLKEGGGGKKGGIINIRHICGVRKQEESLRCQQDGDMVAEDYDNVGAVEGLAMGVCEVEVRGSVPRSAPPTGSGGAWARGTVGAMEERRELHVREGTEEREEEEEEEHPWQEVEILDRKADKQEQEQQYKDVQETKCAARAAGRECTARSMSRRRKRIIKEQQHGEQEQQHQGQQK
ncbi:hypothetical protein CBR_g688 [Chara braunii]|uniref:Uncharacterized protein n=1 Tax=Chara braunii TaxID=69332 RepID=A0A388KBZ7_CHABU|nr:hypothetical protein CBR_g688 [Chara braunii]|eukprot:GBG67559.1 hypothetical protein CBR_g688 [Chara braunii]